jgi:predicted RNase H-like HicB family nuclease
MAVQRFYVAIIERARNGYRVFFPDLPGCTSFGATVAEAAANVFAAAQAHAALSAEHREALPTSRSQIATPTDPGDNGKQCSLVPVKIGLAQNRRF